MFQYAMPLYCQIYIENGQRRDIRAIERLHLAGALFGGAIASKNFIVEVDDDFRDLERTCNHQSTEQIINSITTQLTDRNLTSSDDHRFI